MTTTTAHLATKKLTDETGITDEAARRMFDDLGSEYVAIVYLKATERSEGVGENAKHKVKLTAFELEIAPDKQTAEYLRELAQAIYRHRTPQPTLDAPGQEAVDEVVRRGKNALTLLHGDDEKGEAATT